MSSSFDIKKICDESLDELFSKEYFEKEKRKELKDNTEPLYSEIDKKNFIYISRSSIILEKIYFNQVKNCCI